MHLLVPELILKNYADNRDRTEFMAAVMFVDLSGFSNMSDDLAKHGHHGSEMLAAVMQAVFEPLVRSVYVHGGFVVGFAGDAITAVFLENDSLYPAAQRSLAAAVDVQGHFARHARHSTSFGDYAISVKIGLAYDQTILEIFRAVEIPHAAFCFRGAAMDRSAAAEHHAKPGQIWLDPSYHALVEAQVRGEFVDGYFHLSGDCDCPPLSLPLPEISNQMTRYMDAFFPEALLHLEAHGEFRPVVNVFVDIPTEVQEGERLQNFMRTVFALQARYGGYFPRPDFGDKGANLLIFWGAPVAYENDIDRALNFVLDLRRETGLQISAGISYRLTYAGFIGSALREDYTGYGWGISLAARMMKSALPGELWVDQQIAQRIEHDYVLDAPQERSFKGFVEKQKVYRLLGRKEVVEMVFTGSFDGREREIEQLTQFVAPLWQGRFAGALVVKGEAGVGKSRLMHEFKGSLLFSENKVYWGICQADEIVRQGFNPLRYWLRQRFGISALASEEDNHRRFSAELEHVLAEARDDELRAELIRTSSFLAALLNIFVVGSLYEQLDANARYENTFIALSVFLRLECLQKPLVLLIEDAHVIDEDTRAFVTYLIRVLTADETRHYPIAIIATARLEGPDLSGTAQHPVRELTLGGLGGTALQKLATQLLGRPVSSDLVRFLEQRADGNPFFVEQVLKYLQENHLLDEHDEQADIKRADQVELFSTDIQSILITRLDRLAQDVKEVVQSASVLGREFELRLLITMLSDADLPDKVQTAAQSDIWIPLSEIRYIFRHALMRDAAYSMQLHSRQRALHKLAVDAIERVYADDLPPHYGELAYHAERGILNEKARHYLKLAGDVARTIYANAQAIDYYTRALKLTPASDLEARYQFLLDRQELHNLIGHRDGSQQDLAHLGEVVTALGDVIKRAKVSMRLAGDLIQSGKYEEALQILETVLVEAEQRQDDGTALNAIEVMTNAIVRLGQYQAGIAYCQQGLALARSEKRRDLEGIFHNALGLILIEDKQIVLAEEHFVKSRFIFEELNLLSKIPMPLSNLGMVAGQMGRLDVARKYYEEGLRLAKKIGHRRGEALVLSNLGWIAGMLGDYRSARSYTERGLFIARETGNLYIETNALINLSASAGALGDYAAARNYAEQALALARKSNDQNGVAWALTFLGHNLFAVDLLEQAASAYREALAIRHSFDQAALAAEPGAGLARALLAQGDLAEARAQVEVILGYIAQGGSLDGTDEPVRVYLNVYLVLVAAKDKRALPWLRAGYQQLNARAASIPDAAARQNFFDGISYNSELVAAFKAAGLEREN